jgi:hypothetical protein
MIMPRYFFHMRDPDGLIHDETGIELADDRAAALEAQRAIGEMLRDAALQGRSLNTTDVEITDASGHIITNVKCAG